MSNGAKLVWSTTGNLPAGLAFDTKTGVISGTPRELQLTPSNFKVTVKNSGGEDCYTFRIIVRAVCPVCEYLVPEWTLSDAMVNTSSVFEALVYNINGANAEITTAKMLNGATLPKGMTFNPVSGAISGTPTVNTCRPVQNIWTEVSNLCEST